MTRTPPHATEIEKIVLGSCMLEAEAVWSVVEILEANDFYTAKHHSIFNAVLRLNKSSITCDLITLTDALKKEGQLKEVGEHYLTEIITLVDAPSNAEHYARIIREKSILRTLIITSTEIASRCYDDSADAFTEMDEAESEILKVRGSKEGGAGTRKAPIKQTIDWLQSIHGTKGGVTGIKSGLPALDELTAGWQETDFVMLAARPGCGKTALGLKFAREAAKKNAVGFFSLEMSARQLTLRLLTSESRVDSQAARTGRMNDDEWPRITKAAGALDSLNLYIDDTPAITPMQLRAKARRLVMDHGVKLIIVDYLQLMRIPGITNKEQEVSGISGALKALAKELNITVIALSQLSRAVELRNNKRPVLSDLRSSGSLEQDPDLVIFLYSNEYYGIHIDDNGNNTDGITELELAKQRNGPTGKMNIAFVKKYGVFEPLSSLQAPRGEYPQDYSAPF